MLDDLNDFLKEILGRVPREDVVDYLQKQGKAELIKRGEKGEEKLLEEYIALESQFPGSEAAPAVLDIPGDDRCEALSRILAVEAARRPDVAGFRSAHLNWKLLKPGSVSAWVKAHGQPVLGGKAPMNKPRGKKTGPPAAPGSPYQAHRLYYYDPSGDTVHSAGLRPGSLLAELKAIATSLCAVHNIWDEPHVTTFILTGSPPPVPLARIELQKNLLWPSESRAIIVIDPILVPQLPFKVLACAKDVLLPDGEKRTKAISKKHLELAVWGEMKRGEPDKSWAVLLDEFNKEFPNWAYKDRTAEVHFARDVRSAWTRVTGRTWE